MERTVFSQTERKSTLETCPACDATFLQSAGLKHHLDLNAVRDESQLGFIAASSLTYVCIAPELCAATY